MRRKQKNAKQTLTEQQKQAAHILFETGRMGETAAAVGVHRCTLWRWCKLREFQRERDRIEQQWQREHRKQMLKEIRESPEHQRKLAAKRRLRALERRLEEAGESGDMRAYKRAVKEYNRCFSEAYPAWNNMFSSHNPYRPKKKPEPVKYIVTIID